MLPALVPIAISLSEVTALENNTEAVKQNEIKLAKQIKSSLLLTEVPPRFMYYEYSRKLISV